MTVNRRKRIHWIPSLDQVYLVIVLAGILFFSSLVPLYPNDFWWHLKVGEVIVTTRKIASTNMFAWTLPAAQPFTYGAWLGEVLLYLLYKLNGVALVTFVRTILHGITWFIVGVEARRRSGSWRIAGLVVLLGFAMMSSNLTIRPQIWSWVPFVLFLTMLSRFSDNQLNIKWLFVCPLLMVFWVNAHGAFVLGGILLGIFFASEVIRQLLINREKRDWYKSKWFAIILIVTFLAVMVNPKGPGIIGYVLNLMTDQPSQQYIEEWQSPTPEGAANIIFFASILIFLIVFRYLTISPRLEDIIIFVGFLWLAWSGVRYVIWFSFATMPILSEALIQLTGAKSTIFRRAGLRNVLNTILVILVMIPVILVQPWFFDRLSFPLPEKYKELILEDTGEGPFLSATTPIAAAEYLAQHPGRQMYNEMGYGSYFIWALPDMGVFIDPRVELYPLEQWLDYSRIMHGIRYNTLLEKYGATRIVLDVILQENLAKSLIDDPTWTCVYKDSRTQIWDKVMDTQSSLLVQMSRR